MQVTDLSLEEAAKRLAGNWKRFDSFYWARQDALDDGKAWGLIFTSNRDSGLLEQSNAASIVAELNWFADPDNFESGEPDLVFESHSHWAVGHVDGFSLRVYNKEGSITEAFRRYYELACKLADYPILDESDYAERKYNATIENIKFEGYDSDTDCSVPNGWAEQVYGWLSDNNPSAIENRDDQGGD